jgi:hypothetical protein
MDNVKKAEEVLKALEPWLQQLLRWNPEDKFLDEARKKTSEKIVELIKEIE